MRAPRQTVSAEMRDIIRRGDLYSTPLGEGGRSAFAALSTIIRDVTRWLKRALMRIPGVGGLFTEFHREAFLRVFDEAARRMRERLRALHASYVTRAMRNGERESLRAVAVMETLLGRRPVVLRLDDRELGALSADLESSHVAAVTRVVQRMRDRFGAIVAVATAIRAKVVRVIQVLTTGTRGAVSAVLPGARATGSRAVERPLPGGIVASARGRLTRIVRTEIARAKNLAAGAIVAILARRFPDFRKKIVATWDARTAYDSKFVHGQIRRVDETFLDGAGRVYLLPPARPNDREVVIPWRLGWPETSATRPRPPYAGG